MGFLENRLPAEQARKQMDEKMARDLRRLRIAKWAAIVFSLLLIAFGVLFFTVIRPALAYRAAERALEEGRYDDAIKSFTALADYKDAPVREQESRYRKAVYLLGQEKYEEAYRMFVALGAYEDSSEMALESRYQKAQGLEEAGERVAAAGQYAEVNGYKDAGERAPELLLLAARTLEAAGEYDEAYPVYAALAGSPEADARLAGPQLAAAAERSASVWRDLEAGDIVTLGVYEQDNNASDGPEPIEWLVLEADGDSALLITRYCLDCKVYHNSLSRTTWEACALREWLNDSFYIDSFTEGEKARIAMTTVVAEENVSSPYNPDPGNDTRDHVFLLSVSEAKRLFASDAARVCYATPSALEHGAYASTGNETWWWLRNPGNFGAYAPFVASDGTIDVYGNSNVNVGEVVRPALRVKLY